MFRFNINFPLFLCMVVCAKGKKIERRIKLSNYNTNSMRSLGERETVVREARDRKWVSISTAGYFEFSLVYESVFH